MSTASYQTEIQKHPDLALRYFLSLHKCFKCDKLWGKQNWQTNICVKFPRFLQPCLILIMIRRLLSVGEYKESWPWPLFPSLAIPPPLSYHNDLEPIGLHLHERKEYMLQLGAACSVLSRVLSRCVT